MTEKHHECEVYGNFFDVIEDFIEECLILAEEVLVNYFCPHCHQETVHRLFRENPDSSFDEVGLKCRTCEKIF